MYNQSDASIAIHESHVSYSAQFLIYYMIQSIEYSNEMPGNYYQRVGRLSM